MQINAPKLIFYALLFLGLISYPFVAAFDRAEQLFGFPLLYAYLFLIWASFISVLYFLSKTLSKNSRGE
jgi:hypothetical protein